VGTSYVGWTGAQQDGQCVNIPLHHKVPKFFSGTGSPRWSRKKGHKTVVVVDIQVDPGDPVPEVTFIHSHPVFVAIIQHL